MAFAVIWLAGFSLFFFTRPMPNLRASFAETRAEAWQAVPWVMLDWLLPDAADSSESSLSSRVRSGWRYLPERLILWSWAALILAGAWGIGHWLLRWLIPNGELTSLEHFVFASGVGLSLVSLITLLFGLCGFLHRGVLTTMLTTFFVTAIGELVWTWWIDRELARPADSVNSPKAARWSKWTWVCLGILLPFLVVMVLGGISPSTDFDVKEYHFGGPKEFFLAGRVQFLEHNVYTSFPFLTEMLTLLGMVLQNDWSTGALVGKSVLMTFVPLTGLAILAAGRRWFGNLAGWLGMLIWLTTPWAARIAIIAYAEGGLTCYLFLAFFATGIALGQLRQGNLQPGLFCLAGLLAGSAMACKYTGLVTVVFPMSIAIGFVVFQSARRDESPRPRSQLWRKTAGAFALGVALTIGPWLIKNVVETGNPVYPLAWSIFGGRDWDAQLNAQWTQAHSPPHHRLSSLLVLENGSPGWIFDLTAVNDWLSPLLYGFAPLVFLAAAYRQKAKVVWLFTAWLFIAWWGFTHRLDRFWVPMLPVVALLAGAGASWNSGRLWKTVRGVMIGLALLFNFVLIATQNAGYVAWLSHLRDAEKFTARLTAPEIDFLNRLSESSEPEMRVLSVGDAEVFDARFPVVYNTVFDRSIFHEWTAKPTSGLPPAELPMLPPETIRERFRQEGITHVLVNWQEILRYRLTYGFSRYVTPRRFHQLVEQGVLEVPEIRNRQRWENLNQSQQRELTDSGWRELLGYETSAGETIILSALYRVR